MYEADGITLTGDEFKLLQALYEADDAKALARELLETDAERYRGIFCTLKKKRLLSGIAADNSFIFLGLTPTGRSLVPDYLEQIERGKREKEDGYRHDYLVQIVGAVVTFLLGMLTEHFTGIIALIFR